MKRKVAAALCALLALVLLAGCASPFAADYSWSEPYMETADAAADGTTEIRNYNMLVAALTNMISNHRTSGQLRFGTYNGSVTDDVAAACYEIRNANPLGVWAVEDLDYSTSRIVSYYVADISISYRKTAAEINSLITAVSDSDFEILVTKSLRNRAETMLFRLYSGEIDADRIRELAESAFLNDPDFSLLCRPTLTISTYPEEGTNRIFEITADYGLDDETFDRISAMLRDAVSEELAAARAELPEADAETADVYLALALAEQLSGQAVKEPVEDSYLLQSTAFSALVEHRRDPAGIALAYRMLCSAAGIESRVVSGTVGTMGEEPHNWNLVRLNGDWYHVDVSAFAEDPASAFLLTDEMLWGSYLWNAEDYPSCDGPLRYEDFAPETERAEGAEETGDVPEEESPEPSELPPETEPPVSEPPASEAPAVGTPTEDPPTPETPVPEDPETAA